MTLSVIILQMLYHAPCAKTVKFAFQTKIEKFTQLNNTTYQYQGEKQVFYIVFYQNGMKSCTCPYYLKNAICSHIVCICHHFKIDLFGFTAQRVFQDRRARGRPKKATAALEID